MTDEKILSDEKLKELMEEELQLLKSRWNNIEEQCKENIIYNMWINTELARYKLVENKEDLIKIIICCRLAISDDIIKEEEKCEVLQ